MGDFIDWATSRRLLRGSRPMLTFEPNVNGDPAPEFRIRLVPDSIVGLDELPRVLTHRRTVGVHGSTTDVGTYTERRITVDVTVTPTRPLTADGDESSAVWLFRSDNKDSAQWWDASERLADWLAYVREVMQPGRRGTLTINAPSKSQFSEPFLEVLGRLDVSVESIEGPYDRANFGPYHRRFRVTLTSDGFPFWYYSETNDNVVLSVGTAEEFFPVLPLAVSEANTGGIVELVSKSLVVTGLEVRSGAITDLVVELEDDPGSEDWREILRLDGELPSVSVIDFINRTVVGDSGTNHYGLVDPSSTWDGYSTGQPGGSPEGIKRARVGGSVAVDTNLVFSYRRNVTIGSGGPNADNHPLPWLSWPGIP